MPMQAGDTLLLDVAPQFWTSPAVNEAFTDLHKGGQVGRERDSPGGAHAPRSQYACVHLARGAMLLSKATGSAAPAALLVIAAC